MPTVELIKRIAADIKTKKVGFSISGNMVVKKEALLLYSHLTGFKKTLPPIENLDKEEKLELWQMVKEMFPGKKENELIELCKAVYVIGHYL